MHMRNFATSVRDIQRNLLVLDSTAGGSTNHGGDGTFAHNGPME